MSADARPRKPHPDCSWDDQAGVWRWPDDRSEARRASDELAAEMAETGAWEDKGFRRKHSARVDGETAHPGGTHDR